MTRRKRGVCAALAAAASLLVAASSMSGPAQGSSASTGADDPRLIPIEPNIVAKGLDNPRQLSRTPFDDRCIARAFFGEERAPRLDRLRAIGGTDRQSGIDAAQQPRAGHDHSDCGSKWPEAANSRMSWKKP